MVSKSKAEALKKYLKPKKKKSINRKIKISKSQKSNIKVIDKSVQQIKLPSQNQEIEDYVVEPHSRIEDELPQIVETEESSKLTNEERQTALDDLIKIKAKNNKKIQNKNINDLSDNDEDEYSDEYEDDSSSKNKNGKSTSGTWVTISNSLAKDQKESQGSMEQERQDSIDDSDLDSSSSEEMRVRHDSSDSDMDEEEEEEIKKDMSDRNMMTRVKLAKALGDPLSKIGNLCSSDQESDSDIDDGLTDSSVSSIEGNNSIGNGAGTKMSLAQRLELEKKKDELQRQAAENFKNQETIFRQKDGMQIKVEDLKESKKIKLEKLNAALLREWKSGYRQTIEKREEKQKINNMKKGSSTLEVEYALERDLERLNSTNSIDDPLRLILGDKQKNYHINTWLQTIPSRFPPLSNRYGIKPGYMWDGVDRSNGYEKRYLAKLNELKNQDQEEYVQHARHL